jgi:hypothetical protein
MYGVKLLTADEERNELREFMKEFSVPVSALKDEKYMEQKRKCWALNLSMPGAIENEHPHRFLKLRFFPGFYKKLGLLKSSGTHP